MAGYAKKKRARMISKAITILRNKGLGFSGPIVRSTINKLLKEYGGDVGWPFIRECRYQLVIDTILNDMEEAEQKTKNGVDVKIVEATEKFVEEGEPSYIPKVADGEPVPQNPIPADNNQNLDLPFGVVAPLADPIPADNDPNIELPVESDAPFADPFPADNDPNVDLPMGADAPFADPIPADNVPNVDPPIGADASFAVSIPADNVPNVDLPMGADSPFADSIPDDIDSNLDNSVVTDEPVADCPRETVEPRASPVSVPPRPRRKPCYGYISETESESEEDAPPMKKPKSH